MHPANKLDTFKHFPEWTMGFYLYMSIIYTYINMGLIVNNLWKDFVVVILYYFCEVN